MLITSRGDACRRFPRLRQAARRLLYAAREQPVARQAVAVAEPLGRATLQRLPQQLPSQACGLITVMTANLWHDFPLYRRQEERLEHFARLVEQVGADILLLQEVSRRPALQVDRWLAERLGMSFVYSRSNGHLEIGFEEGLAIFSRFPFTSPPLLHQLSRSCNPFVRRMVLATEVQTSCGPLLALSVHLALSRSQNARQLAGLADWIERFSPGQALVVGGDFNASEHSRQIRHARSQWTDTFRHLHPQADGTTHAIHSPWGTPWLRHRLDYIFLRAGPTPWEVVEARHLGLSPHPHSDHLSVLARLALDSGGTPTSAEDAEIQDRGRGGPSLGGRLNPRLDV
jgi:endonuclease/exonuclease/phosphatase family metal-dependent hydrolase